MDEESAKPVSQSSPLLPGEPPLDTREQPVLFRVFPFMWFDENYLAAVSV